MKYAKKGRANYISCFLICLIVILIQVIPVYAGQTKKEEKVLRVAFPVSTGINEVYEDGTYGGTVYEWLMEISKYTGWKYEFITGDTNKLLKGMKDKEYDLMGGMFRQDWMEEIYCYPTYSMGYNYSLLIYRQEDESIKSYDYKTLNGKKVGVFANAINKIERLKKFLDFNEVECEFVYYEDVEKYEECLKDPEIDLMLGSDVYMTDEYNVAAKFPSESCYIVTAKDEPELCKELDRAIEAIYAANPNFAIELYNKYFPYTYLNAITFTEEEQEFINTSEPMKVAVIKDQYPLYYEQDGKKKWNYSKVNGINRKPYKIKVPVCLCREL